MLLNFNNYEFRASESWNLFSEPKAKAAKDAGELSEGCKTWLHDIWLREKYGYVKTDLTGNKYLEKGIIREGCAVQLTNDVLYPNEFLLKNTERKRNGLITGECDIYINSLSTVIDTKCSWDLDTFHWAELNKRYEIQLRCYGFLWGAENLVLCYCLLNTPQHLIKYEPEYDYESMIPKESRVKCFTLQKDDTFAQKLETRVMVARDYLNQITL